MRFPTPTQKQSNPEAAATLSAAVGFTLGRALRGASPRRGFAAARALGIDFSEHNALAVAQALDFEKHPGSGPDPMAQTLAARGGGAALFGPA